MILNPYEKRTCVIVLESFYNNRCRMDILLTSTLHTRGFRCVRSLFVLFGPTNVSLTENITRWGLSLVFFWGLEYRSR